MKICVFQKILSSIIVLTQLTAYYTSAQLLEYKPIFEASQSESALFLSATVFVTSAPQCDGCQTGNKNSTSRVREDQIEGWSKQLEYIEAKIQDTDLKAEVSNWREAKAKPLGTWRIRAPKCSITRILHKGRSRARRNTGKSGNDTERSYGSWKAVYMSEKSQHHIQSRNEQYVHVFIYINV